MHADTSFHNGSGASTKWRETFENVSFEPKVVDWACSLLENKKWFYRHKLVYKMCLDTGFCNVSSAATKWHGTTQNMSFRLKPWIGHVCCDKTRNGFGGINSCI